MISQATIHAAVYAGAVGFAAGIASAAIAIVLRARLMRPEAVAVRPDRTSDPWRDERGDLAHGDMPALPARFPSRVIVVAAIMLALIGPREVSAREIAFAARPLTDEAEPPTRSAVDLTPFVDLLTGCHYIVARTLAGAVAITPRLNRVGLPVCQIEEGVR